ncbi:MepB family protein [Paenibacillus sp. N3.4]|uniref:MepB family protein n=1 Tax=Paenibacillus sp. N3.4 TaxID=2603222 RepID=UPI0011CBD469|nr:MepB family protein [Paenibacillus sp. N3.4]TXK74142.1 hypothetical protein FU659_29700 [Paenibacillus sp. N3.4]
MYNLVNDKSGDGPIQPYDSSDSVDLYVISTREDSNFGQFIFTNAVLCAQDIVSKS